MIKELHCTALLILFGLCLDFKPNLNDSLHLLELPKKIEKVHKANIMPEPCSTQFPKRFYPQHIFRRDFPPSYSVVIIVHDLRFTVQWCSDWSKAVWISPYKHGYHKVTIYSNQYS